MKKLIVFAALAVALAFVPSAGAQLSGACANGSAPLCKDSQTISTSGGSVTVTSNGGLAATFEEVISGSPATISIVIQGCGDAATCTTLDTYTTATTALRSPTISVAYAYYKITATWTGGTSPSVTINTRITTAALIGGGSLALAGAGVAGSSNGTALNMNYATDALNNAAIQTAPIIIYAGTGNTSPVLSTFSALGTTYLFADDFPSTCPNISTTSTTNLDCAIAWAIKQDTGGTAPCNVYEIMLSANQNYSSKQAYIDNSACTGMGYMNHGIGFIGQSWGASQIQVSSNILAGGTQAEPYWWQSKNSTYPSGAVWHDVNLYTANTYNQDYGAVALAGIEHVYFSHMHVNGFSNREPDNIRSFGLLGWASAHLDIGGVAGGNVGAGNYEIELVDVGTETDTQVFFPGTVVPTLGSTNDVLPAGASAYNGITQTWNNGIVSGATLATCGSEGYDYGTGSSNCVGGLQHTRTAVYTSPYRDGSTLSSTTQASVAQQYTFPPKAMLYGWGQFTSPGRVAARFSTVPNEDVEGIFWQGGVGGTESSGNDITMHQQRYSCGTQPTITSNYIGYWNSSATTNQGFSINAANPLTVWPLVNWQPTTGGGGALPSAVIQFAGTNLQYTDTYVGGQTDWPSYAPYGFVVIAVAATHPASAATGFTGTANGVPLLWISPTSQYSPGYAAGGYAVNAYVTYGGTQTGYSAGAPHIWKNTLGAVNANTPGGTGWTDVTTTATDVDAYFIPTISSGALTALTYLGGNESTGYSTSGAATVSTEIGILGANGGIAYTFLSNGPGADCPSDVELVMRDEPPTETGINIDVTDSSFRSLIAHGSGRCGVTFQGSGKVSDYHEYYTEVGFCGSAGSNHSNDEDDTTYRVWAVIDPGVPFTEVGTTHFWNYPHGTGTDAGSYVIPTPHWTNHYAWYQISPPIPNTFGNEVPSIYLAGDYDYSQFIGGDPHTLIGDTGPADIGLSSPTTGADLGYLYSKQVVSPNPAVQPFNWDSSANGNYPSFVQTTNSTSPDPTVFWIPPVAHVSYSQSITGALAGIAYPAYLWTTGGFPYGVGNSGIGYGGQTGAIGGTLGADTSGSLVGQLNLSSTALTITTAGAGCTTATGLALSDTTGVGYNGVVSITASAGAVTAVTTTTAGTAYSVGEQLNVGTAQAGCTAVFTVAAGTLGINSNIKMNGTATAGSPTPQELDLFILDANGVTRKIKNIFPYVLGGPVGYSTGTLTLAGTGSSGCSFSATTYLINGCSNYTTGTAVNVTYTGTCAVGTGCTGSGTGPFHYSVSGGQLPPGLSLRGDGVLIGTPSQTGTYTWEFTIDDPSYLVGTTANTARTVVQQTVTVVAGTSNPMNSATFPTGIVGFQTTVAMGAAAGTVTAGPTWTTNPTTSAGTFTFTSGTGTTGTVATVNFANTTQSQFYNCGAWLTIPGSTAAVVALQTTIGTTANGVTPITIKTGSALSSTTAYSVTYNCQQ